MDVAVVVSFFGCHATGALRDIQKPAARETKISEGSKGFMRDT